MLLFENLNLAIHAIFANKIRSLLTMLGIIIGIASVITIVSIGETLSNAATGAVSSFGDTDLTMGIKRREKNDDGLGESSNDNKVIQKKEDKITPAMLEDIFEEFKGRVTGYATEMQAGEAVVLTKGKETKLNMKGNNNEAMKKENLNMLAGRQFMERDQKEEKHVAVVSDIVVNSALKVSPEQALGKELTIIRDGQFYYFTVVGVYKYKESAMDMFSGVSATTFYIPINTAFRITHNDKVFEQVHFIPEEGEDKTKLIDDLTKYTNDKYYRNNANFMINVVDNSSFLKEVQSLLTGISAAITVIAGISLLVGGIGVMNIMLVSIQERTREIGTRKALGAKNSQIMAQFIAEAIVLCLVGGIIGSILGVLGGYGALTAYNMYSRVESVDMGMTYEAMKFSVPYKGIVVALTFSSFVGVFFGYYPAKKAANMNPIDALRYE